MRFFEVSGIGKVCTRNEEPLHQERTEKEQATDFGGYHNNGKDDKLKARAVISQLTLIYVQYIGKPKQTRRIVVGIFSHSTARPT